MVIGKIQAKLSSNHELIFHTATNLESGMRIRKIPITRWGAGRSNAPRGRFRHKRIPVLCRRWHSIP